VAIVDYRKRLQEIRGGGGPISAVAERAPRKMPASYAGSALAVRAGYARKCELSAFLTDKYEACSVSPKALSFTDPKRRKEYCARVAWTIAKRSERFRDYPGFSERGHMAKAKKKSGKKKSLRGRPRDAKGRLLSNAQVARRSAAKRGAAKRKRAAASKPKPRKAARRRNPVPNPLPNPVPKKKATARRRRPKVVTSAAPVTTIVLAREEAKENKTMAAKKKTAKKGKSAKKKPAAAEAPRKASKHPKKSGSKKSAKRRSVVVKGTTTRRYKTPNGKAHTRKQDVNVSITLRPEHMRRASAKKKAHPKPKKKTAKKGKKLTHQQKLARQVARDQRITATAGENPLGMESYAFENPMGGGELALAVGLGVAGYTLADIVSRYMATRGQPTANYATLTQAAPGMGNLLVQVGVGAGLLFAGTKMNGAFSRAAVQGMGFGVFLHAAQQVLTHWVVVPLINKTSYGPQLYGDVTAADAAAAQLTAATGASGAASGASGSSAASGSSGTNTSGGATSGGTAGDSGSSGATAGDTGNTGGSSSQGTTGPGGRTSAYGRRFDPGPHAGHGMGMADGGPQPQPIFSPPQNYLPPMSTTPPQPIYGTPVQTQPQPMPLPGQGGSPCGPSPCGAAPRAQSNAAAYGAAMADIGMSGVRRTPPHEMNPD
jgi:hypothetical protein